MKADYLNYLKGYFKEKFPYLSLSKNIKLTFSHQYTIFTGTITKTLSFFVYKKSMQRRLCADPSESKSTNSLSPPVQ